jgi:hypothetical protein
MNQVMDYVSDGELKRIIDRSKAEHRKVESEADNLLARFGQYSKEPEMMAKAMSWISTEMKMMMRDDDKQAAKIMMDGCNMGIQSISGSINQYSGAIASSVTIAKELVKIEEDFRDELKKYV